MPKLPSGFRKKNGGYEYRFRIAGEYKSVSGATIEECRQRYDKLLELSRQSLVKGAESITLDEYFESWIKGIAPSVKKSTVFSYRKKYKAISSVLGNRKVQSIKRSDVLNAQACLCASYSTSTVNYLTSLLRRILEDSVADNIILKNPCVSIKGVRRTGPKARDTIHRALTLEEQNKFFVYAADSYYFHLFRFLTLTGLRIGEAAALRWKDIDDVIHVSKTVSQTDYSEFEISSTKTEAGSRIVPCNNNIRKVLADQKTFVADFHGIRYCKSDSVVFPPLRNPSNLLRSSMVDSAIDSVLKRMNKDGCHIEHFTVHGFRDTFATRALEQGMNMNTLKEILGHTKIAITMDLYGHVLPNTKMEAMQHISIEV